MKQNWIEVLGRIQQDPRYLENLDWGKPRRGHPEGTVRAHIRELEQNLATLANDAGTEGLSVEEIDRLRILIHVHDTFKADAKRGVSIEHPQSHASLAAAFLGEILADYERGLQHSLQREVVDSPLNDQPLSAESADLVAIVQNHDVPYAMWLKFQHHHTMPDTARLRQLLDRISDWRHFAAFLIIDNGTVGKSRDPLLWFLPFAAEFKPEVAAWRGCSLLN